MEEHAAYKTAVSSPAPAEADLPLARPVKASWWIYILYGVGVLHLLPKLLHLFLLFLFFHVVFVLVYSLALAAIKIKILTRDRTCFFHCIGLYISLGLLRFSAFLVASHVMSASDLCEKVVSFNNISLQG